MPTNMYRSCCNLVSTNLFVDMLRSARRKREGKFYFRGIATRSETKNKKRVHCVWYSFDCYVKWIVMCYFLSSQLSSPPETTRELAEKSFLVLRRIDFNSFLLFSPLFLMLWAVNAVSISILSLALTCTMRNHKKWFDGEKRFSCIISTT